MKSVATMLLGFVSAFAEAQQSGNDAPLENITLNIEVKTTLLPGSKDGKNLTKEDICSRWGNHFYTNKGPWKMGFASNVSCSEISKPGNWILRMEEQKPNSIRVSLIRKPLLGDKEIEETSVTIPGEDWQAAGANSAYSKVISAAILDDSPLVARCQNIAQENCTAQKELGDTLPELYSGTLEKYKISIESTSGVISVLPPDPTSAAWLVQTSEHGQNQQALLRNAALLAAKIRRTSIEQNAPAKPKSSEPVNAKNLFLRLQPRSWASLSTSLVPIDSPTFERLWEFSAGGSINAYKNIRLGLLVQRYQLDFKVISEIRYRNETVTNSLSVQRSETLAALHLEKAHSLNPWLMLDVKASAGMSLSTLQTESSNTSQSTLLPKNHSTFTPSALLQSAVMLPPYKMVIPGLSANCAYFQNSNALFYGYDVVALTKFKWVLPNHTSFLDTSVHAKLGIGFLSENIKGTSQGFPYTLNTNMQYMRASLSASVTLQ